ncbi:MAG: retroviral-like aspartic protease family protein [Chloroflexi bacterium]|nr:retroviral-like aspartic protease family protein [Chloroflexota bacterium]MCI0648865.1 retroviral-like aspartic protease family protein [Chloroflexota bacterium]
MEGFSLILKFDEEEGGAAVCVKATVQGRPYEFLLDTGAALTSLRWDEFTSQLPGQGIHQSSGLLGDIRDDLITVRDFKLGSIERELLTVARLAESHHQARNLIGMDLLQAFCCSFLFSENRVSLEPRPSDPLSDLFLDDKAHPYVTVECLGSQAPAVWDTGASLTCVDLGFIERHPAAFEEAGQSAGTDASGNSIHTSLFLMKGFSCGGRSFPDHKVVGIDLSFVNSKIKHPMTMILGYSTLGQANWLFDFPRRKWGILEMLPAGRKESP